MTSKTNSVIDFAFRIQKYPPSPCAKFDNGQANVMPNMQVSSFLDLKTHRKQHAAMEVPEYNGNVQNNPKKVQQ